MFSALVVAAFMLAHGLIHASFLTPRPPATAGGPSWPFELNRSWLLTRLGVGSDVTRPLGIALVVLTIAGFALAAVSALGVAPGLWSVGVVVGAVASLAILWLYFHPWLILGILIDIVLLWAITVAGWAPQGFAS
jgi:hypothetical protein